jgi:hypothetical protein
MVGREDARDLIPSTARRLMIGFVFFAYKASTIVTVSHKGSELSR